jgi:Domain of unknown function (DUF4383)
MASSAAARTGTRGAEARTPAQVYSLVFGATLLLAGIVGFFVNSEFGDLGTNVQGDELVLFEVNGWHNVVHVASGLLGLALARSAAGGFAFALGFGLTYALVTVWGLITADNILFGLAPVNGADNLLHAAIAAAGILAALASRPRNETSARGAV